MDFVIYSIYLRKLEELQRFEQRLSTPPFMVMLIAAFALHIMVFLVIDPYWRQRSHRQTCRADAPRRCDDSGTQCPAYRAD